MAKTESTAVNELIGLVQSKGPSPSEPAADLFGTPPASRRASSPSLASSQPRTTSTMPTMRGAEVAPLPRSRAPQSTAEQSIPSLPDAGVRMSTAPSPRGSTIPPLPPRARTSAPALPPPRSPAGTLPPPTAPVAAPFESLPAALATFSSPDLPVPRTDLVISPDETWVGTLPATRTREDNVALAKKLIIPGIACIAAGIALGLYVSGTKAKASSNKTPTTAIAPSPATAAPAPAAPPTETVLHPRARSVESANAGTSTAGGEQPEPPTKAEQAAQVAAVASGDAAAGGSLTNDAPSEAAAKIAEAPRGVVKLTDVRIDTDPQGASITLVDRGRQFPLGSTPLSTSLDSSRQYDVIVELPGRPSQTVHLDPAATSRLDISLGRKHRVVAPAAPALKTETKAEVKSAVASSIDAIADEPAVAANGTLMVSSKPPCEIHIDGKATGLTTPQRAIELAPGKHKITFVNQDGGINKTVSVTIKAGEPTKLIQDLMTK